MADQRFDDGLEFRGMGRRNEDPFAASGIADALPGDRGGGGMRAKRLAPNGLARRDFRPNFRVGYRFRAQSVIASRIRDQGAETFEVARISDVQRVRERGNRDGGNGSTMAAGSFKI